MQNLVLTGFMGTGKTAVGQEVARRLGRAFVNMDTIIEKRAGKPIAQIFETGGERAFREMEAALCRELALEQNLVIATGGGALVDPQNRAAFMATSVVVCLSAGVDEILARVGQTTHRPLLAVPDPRTEVASLLAQRQPAYAALPWQVDTTGRSVDEIAADVVALASCRSLPVTHPTGGYDIHIGQGTLSYLGGALRAAGIVEGARIAVISNDTVAPLYADSVIESLNQSGFHPLLCIIPDGESHKTLETVRGLYDQVLAADLDRSGAVLALGGGVTGDIAGFVAATHMRGVRFVQVPTTLLAMTDASVGGKTGVDLPQGKNLVGAFKQPEMVFIDLAVLATLPVEEMRSGMAEVLKHGIIGDPELFATLSGDMGVTITPDVLARSIQVKIDIVEQDPFEGGRRALLNLGHTTGHALERLSNFGMRHGEGVAIGIVAAARIAEATGRASVGLADQIAHAVDAVGLPVRCPLQPGGSPYPVSSIVAAMRHDKKRRGKQLRWVLPVAVGEVVIADDVPDTVLRDVLVGLGAAA